MIQQIIVSLFDHTGNMVAPWAKAGFLCYCVDLQHPPGEHREENIIRVGADVREWLPPYAPIKMLFAFPPCTHVAVSGARWRRTSKPRISRIFNLCLARVYLNGADSELAMRT